MIAYGRQSISQDDIDQVLQVLTSDFLTQGPAIPAFEDAVKAATGAAHAVAANSATSSLHLACLALGLGEGDILWTAPITFVASANVGLLCGAKVDFVDIDPDTFNMCPKALEKKLAQAAENGKLPKIIMPVHMCGQSCAMEQIGGLARQYGIKVIEDASHAIGGRYKDAAVGACTHSDVTVFSFHPVKIVTTAEGGCATTQDEGLARKMALLRSHGVTRDENLMTRASEGPWYYQQVDLGLNYRLTDLQAALGVSQMSRLHEFVRIRNELADSYDTLLADLPLDRPGRSGEALSSFHLYVIRVAAHQRRAVYDALRDGGFGVNVHYIPVHRQPYYEDLGFKPGDFPVAEAYYHRCISIPLHPGVTRGDQERLVEVLRSALS